MASAIHARSGSEECFKTCSAVALAPASTEAFLDALRIMNAASHGVDGDADAAERAIAAGTAFLTELSSQARK
jgi:hypothetical protein